MKWSEDYIEFTNDRARFENINSSIMVPYFTNDVSSADFIWLDIYPNSTEQYAAMEELVKNGGDLSSKWPGNNVRVLSSWQWEISNSPIADGNGISMLGLPITVSSEIVDAPARAITTCDLTINSSIFSKKHFI